MKQAEVFMASEGNAWLKRNKDKIDPERDPVMFALETFKINPANVLEVGCANGWRLEVLERDWGCNAWGVDPCANPFRKKILRNTADKTGMQTGMFDTVIYGWCLYLCDPEDYFSIATEGDRVLADDGYLVIHDFLNEGNPYKNKYKHKEGLFSHKMDFSKLWLGHPSYSLVGTQSYGDGDDRTAVIVLKKDIKNAFRIQG